MAKPIRFPLEMAEGVKVNTIEELRKYFDLEKTLSYYIDGKLLAWLKARYYENEATQIEGLGNEDVSFNSRLCDILGVQCTVLENINITQLEENKKRIAQLKRYTDDEDIERDIDKVAFNQEELTALLNSNVSRIYLCGEVFSISPDKENVSYIGINNPEIKLKEKTDIDFDKKNIILKNLHLTSENEIRIAVRKSCQVTLDNSRLKTSLTFKKILTTFDISKDNSWYYIKVFLYKNLLIQVSTQIRGGTTFNIININTKKTLVSFSDIKPRPVRGYKEQYVQAVTMHKNYLVIFWGEYENIALQLLNLDTLRVEKTVSLPYDSYQHVTSCESIEVYDNRIFLYNALGYSSKVKCQYHEFPSLELLETKVESLIDGDRGGYYGITTFECTYKGKVFKFFLDLKNIYSSQKDYICQGLYGNDGNKGSIGLFKIIDDKIFATYGHDAGTNKKRYDSVADIGEIKVFNLEGGEPSAVIPVFAEDIIGYSSYDGIPFPPEFIDIIHCENIIATLAENVPVINFYDDTSFEALDQLALDLSLGSDNRRSCRVCDAYIDAENHRMAISYNGIIAIYE